MEIEKRINKQNYRKKPGYYKNEAGDDNDDMRMMIVRWHWLMKKQKRKENVMKK